MKIRMRTIAAGPTGTFPEGAVFTPGVDIDPRQAASFLEGGYAEIVNPDEIPPRRMTMEDVFLGRPRAPETAEASPPAETAEADRPRGRRAR